MSEKMIWWIILAVILTTMFLSTSSRAEAQQIVGNTGYYCWTNPTTNTDGSPLTNQGGIILNITKPDGTIQVADVGMGETGTPCPSGTGTTRQASTAQNGSYSVTAQAYNTETPRKVSVESNTITFCVNVCNGVTSTTLPPVSHTPGAPQMLPPK